jgi:hypothetical protein
MASYEVAPWVVIYVTDEEARRVLRELKGGE